VWSSLAASFHCGKTSTEYTNLYIGFTHHNSKCVQICALIACTMCEQEQQQPEQQELE
jgi:hypothetical protein